MERERVVHAEGVPAEAVHDPARRSHVEEGHGLSENTPQQPGVERLRRLYPAEREAERPGDVDEKRVMKEAVGAVAADDERRNFQKRTICTHVFMVCIYQVQVGRHAA